MSQWILHTWVVLSLALMGGCRTTSSSSTVKLEEGAQAPAVWTSEGGNVQLNGKVFHIKGANWFGLETGGANLLGLSKRSMSSLLDWLEQEQFNALRIPLSVQWALDFNHVPADQAFTDADADLRGKPWITVLDKLITEAGKRGIVIMLDMHTIGAGDNLSTKRWYSDRYSVCDFREAWQKVLNRFGNHWNIFALDLKNELHDVDWGNSDLLGSPDIVCRDAYGPHAAPAGLKPTDWRQEVESLVPELDVPRTDAAGQNFQYQGLFLVQGMHHGKVGPLSFPYDIKRPFGFWFGGNLEGLRHYPLRLPESVSRRIAYTVHVYGPSVYAQPYFDQLDGYRHPENLDVVYESQNGFIEPLTGRAVILGEWGGINAVLDGRDDPSKKGKDDGAILGAMAKWFPEHCMADAFWWAINPESTDTGGLLEDDYQRPLGHKLDRARTMMPNPTKVGMGSDGQITFKDPGAFNAQCLELQAHPRPVDRHEQCLQINKDGVTCEDLRFTEGQELCSWGQKWQCHEGCAVWKGTCSTQK